VPDRSVDFLIVGGGLAAARCAETLREEGADGSVLLVGREADPPYHRPPLSKSYLGGSSGRDDALVQPPDWYEENGIELLLRTSVMKLDVGDRVAKLSSREEVGFDKALLATGANVRRLRADGSDLDGIHYLRAFANSDVIREEAAEAERVVMIGGSFIACEVAATLSASLGRQCSLVMQESKTFDRVLGVEVGHFLHQLLEDRGVEVQGEDTLARFEGLDGRVARVVTERGVELEAQCVVIGAGVQPDVMLARQAGLELGESGGVRCSATLETRAPGVFAAGDMAEWHDATFDRVLRVEHWDVAAEHGKTAARNMLGADAPHETLPYFFSDLADWASIEYVGIGPDDGAPPVIRGSVDDGSFTAFYLGEGGVLNGAMTAGRSEDLDHARRLIAGRAAPDSERLADEGTGLAEL
jgi:3-phenylpropionate/trans-cinnamate dioxygenase ferredoxin reductase subunit